MDNRELIVTLNALIETCKDGEYGFRSCAEHVGESALQAVFARHAEECQRAASELQEQVVLLGCEPDTRGSASGALHRGWVAIRSKLSTYDEQDVLKECERGEDVAVARYAAALQNPLPEALRALIERQYQGVQRNRAQIHELREHKLAA